MKKILVGTFLFLCLVFFVFFSQVLNKSDTMSYKLDNKTYQMLVADDPEEHKKGLMYIRKLNNADGMIFLFHDKQIRNFWNKNTLFDLDIYWIVDDKVVGKSFLPSTEKSKSVVTVTSPEPVNKVIELIK